MCHDGIQVQPAGIGNRSFPLREPHQDGSAIGKVVSRVIADIPQSLHDDPLSVESRRELEFVHLLGGIADLSNSVEHAPSGSIEPAPDPLLLDRLAGHAGFRVLLTVRHRLVGVHDPRHLGGAGSVVGGGDIDSRAYETLLDQFVGVTAGDSLELAHRVPAAVDLDSALSAAERDVDDGALECHQGGKGHYFVLGNTAAEPDSALGREFVLAVLGPPRLDYFDRPVVTLQRKSQPVDAVAGSNLTQQPLVEVRQCRCLVERPVDLVEKSEFR